MKLRWAQVTMPAFGRDLLSRSSMHSLSERSVSPTNTGSNQLFAETSAVPGQGLSVGSQRNFSNSFIVDGLSANDDAAGLSGVFYGLDTVQEFQVVTSGGQAEMVEGGPRSWRMRLNASWYRARVSSTRAVTKLDGGPRSVAGFVNRTDRFGPMPLSDGNQGH